MTIAGKISLGGSVALSLATAVLAFMVSGTKTQFANQLRGVEEALRGGKFPTLGLQYTGDFMTDTSQPAASVSQSGERWNATNDDLTSTKGTLKTTEENLTEQKAKNQELTLQADKLSKDLETTKSDLESTNSKLKVTAEQLQAFEESLKGKKPDELFQEINDLSEKVKVAESEQKMLTAAREKSESELKKLKDQLEMTKLGGTKSISLSGRILAVNPTWNFVILDLGKNDMVVEGLTMVIYRGEKMIGRIKTVTVDAQTSVADILPDTPARAIEVGDQVVY
jgi:predicted RNase H-like nuclease (RuvC/YqgF family)